MSIPPLLTPSQAIQLVRGVSQRTAQRRIVEAAKRQRMGKGEPGDELVQSVGGAWCAPESWWREEFRRRPPRSRGRPPQRLV